MANEMVMPKDRILKPGSPEQIRRDELLAIMRDPNRANEERLQAAIEALPLCHEPVPPIVTINGRIANLAKDSKR